MKVVPPAVAFRLSGSTHTCIHTELPLASGQPPRKARVAQQKAQENDYSHMFTETAVRERHEFTAVSNAQVGYHAPTLLFCSGKERNDEESVLVWLLCIHETKKLNTLRNPVDKIC